MIEGHWEVKDVSMLVRGVQKFLTSIWRNGDETFATKKLEITWSPVGVTAVDIDPRDQSIVSSLSANNALVTSSVLLLTAS